MGGRPDRAEVLCPSALPIGSLVVPFLGLPYGILKMSRTKELLRSLWVSAGSFWGLRVFGSAAAHHVVPCEVLAF